MPRIRSSFSMNSRWAFHSGFCRSWNRISMNSFTRNSTGMPPVSFRLNSSSGGGLMTLCGSSTSGIIHPTPEVYNEAGV